MKSPRSFFVMFYNVHKENMFTIEIEDGRAVDGLKHFYLSPKYSSSYQLYKNSFPTPSFSAR